MSFPKIAFKITENRQCPLFEYGDIFTLTGISISLNNVEENSTITTSIIHGPTNKKSCKILNGDLTKIVMQFERSDKIPVCIVSCSGCTGSIQLEYNKQKDLLEHDPISSGSNELASMIHLFSDFSFFRNIDKPNLDKVVQFFKLHTFKKNDIVIRKGDPGGNFYIIVTGSVNVINDVGITISTLTKGDVFGEMSLICNESVSATIQVAEDTSILYINQKNFKRILDHYPEIQLYFSRLMANRLNKSNTIRAEDLASGITGKLSEIPPEALFQTLNMNNKTGILTITGVTFGTARYSFRQGSLIKAKYGNFFDEEAFYEILKEPSGRFRFTPGIPQEDFELPEISYFMKLLMEGMRRLDEVKKEQTATPITATVLH